jgi:glycosyltransferase involved in cell wall biosynthesis
MKDSGPFPMLSFVIPAFNEARLIGATIDSIHGALEGRYAYEIIVVDNGSTDDTAPIAARAGATVLSRPQDGLAALRNEGVTRSSGHIIVFLDADVVLKPEWARNIHDAVRRLTSDPLMVLGSVCDVPDGAGLLERAWFDPKYSQRYSHVGTGHMLISRALFDQLGGFETRLETGEDYDLSHRARALGAHVVLDGRLRVEHRGNPTTPGSFTRREIWHGASDFTSWNTLRRSPVALAATAFLGLHLLLVLSLAMGWSPGIVVAAGGVTSLCVASSVRKYRGAPLWVLGVNTATYYIYYLGRGVSAFFRRGARGVRASRADATPQRAVVTPRPEQDSPVSR